MLGSWAVALVVGEEPRADRFPDMASVVWLPCAIAMYSEIYMAFWMCDRVHLLC
ncbi:hypothetical protein CC77DRAFT_1020616 [Alternaria alternata]|jgi:hypothetical protein|uniref:Uncharacterized protein n=1 Tax=Alternaria alternata TaxID=5599 RepID=A0A177DMM6_ALTAL|nr:hypothetical protein CC77DRAFT_1020616 [Alternaria alternata]OAG20069.1 hypothetical protein CC77DRAFT_1020616 [Alternaria alternata]